MSLDSLDLSVVVPFKNHAKLTLDCLESFVAYGPDVRELLLVDNASEPRERSRVEAFCRNRPQMRILDYDRPFNFQTVNNWAATRVGATHILFLNNDTELTAASRGLVEKMYEKASEPAVGAVGCLLLYGDASTIQHAGVFLVSGGLADHVYVGEDFATVLMEGGSNPRYPYRITEDRPMTAVTAAVCMVEKRKFDAVGGFDERFVLCGGDVDLCIRLARAGFATWYVSTHDGYILHKESRSRIDRVIPFGDFVHSYRSYRTAYDPEIGDVFLPDLCELHENRQT